MHPKSEVSNMQLTDVTLVSFVGLGAIRCLSYLPQILRIVRDENGASAISYTTWYTWTLANLATASYAWLNLGDAFLAAISAIYAVCCTAVIVLTGVKRAQHAARVSDAQSPYSALA
jgi:amino acid permease